jgi:hypothetical protein
VAHLEEYVMLTIPWIELAAWLFSSFCLGSGLTSWYWGKRIKRLAKEFNIAIDLIRGIYNDHNS